MTWMTPFEHEFMLRAFSVGMLIGLVCAIFSCFLVLKGWSLMGDAISHAVFPGIVIAYLINIPLVIGAFFAGLLCAVSTGYIKEHSRIKEDTAMGVIFTGLFALGMVIFSKIETDQHLNHILFGNLLGIPDAEFMQTMIISIVALAGILFIFKDLLLFCFDPIHAQTIGLNTHFLYYAMLSLLALIIVAALQAVGIILVVAMLIAPGCIGLLLASRFPFVVLISVASAVISCFFGAYISFFINASTGACIVLFQALLFFLALLFAPRKGILANARRPRHQKGA